MKVTLLLVAFIISYRILLRGFHTETDTDTETGTCKKVGNLDALWTSYNSMQDILICPFVGLNIGGSKGGEQGTPPPPPPRRAEFLHFHAVFGENRQNHGSVTV